MPTRSKHKRFVGNHTWKPATYQTPQLILKAAVFQELEKQARAADISLQAYTAELISQAVMARSVPTCPQTLVFSRESVSAFDLTDQRQKESSETYPGSFEII